MHQGSHDNNKWHDIPDLSKNITAYRFYRFDLSDITWSPVQFDLSDSATVFYWDFKLTRSRHGRRGIFIKKFMRKIRRIQRRMAK